MTLQIAWSGVIATEQHPANVPRFPTLSQERFMAYQAIVNGARGLAFFGGHLTQIARPADAQAGWNWTFWERVLRPLLEELTSDSVAPALVAPERAQAGQSERQGRRARHPRGGRFPLRHSRQARQRHEPSRLQRTAVQAHGR